MSSSVDSRVDESGALAVVRQDEEWRWRTVAPDFEVFRGRKWEAEYPALLREFYKSFGGACCGRGCGVCRTCGCTAATCYVDKSCDSADVSSAAGASGFGDQVCNEGRCSGDNGSFGGATRTASGSYSHSTVVEGVSESSRPLGPNGGLSKGRGPNYEKNQLRRLAKRSEKKNKKKEEVVSESYGVLEVKAVDESESGQNLSVSDKLKKSFDERRIAENELATQRARYNIRRNDYLQKARVSEQKWETERLTSDEKLRRISEARLGASPGFAKTIVEEGLASPSAPSMSDGTVSPDSSISVEEVQKMNRTIEKQAAAVVELQKKLDKFVEMFGDEGETVDDIIYPEQRKRDSTPQEPTHKVMWGECVPLKGRYKFQADHHQNGNLVMAIDGEIVEVDWRGEPFEYCGKDVLYVTPSMNGHIDE